MPLSCQCCLASGSWLLKLCCNFSSTLAEAEAGNESRRFQARQSLVAVLLLISFWACLHWNQKSRATYIEAGLLIALAHNAAAEKLLLLHNDAALPMPLSCDFPHRRPSTTADLLKLMCRMLVSLVGEVFERETQICLGLTAAA